MNKEKSKKKKIDFKSYRFKVWATLMSFAVVIIGLLWISQVIFLDYYLNSYKSGEYREYSKDLIPRYGDEEFYNKSAGKYGCTIDVLEFQGNDIVVKFTSNGLNFGAKGDVFNADDQFRHALSNASSDGESVLKDSAQSRHFYCYKMSESRILVLGQSTEMIDATAKILRTQMLIASITILILMTCLSIFLSEILGKDISKLSKGAKILAKGDYNVEFEEKGATEIAEIATTLNYATREMAVATKLRRELIANVSHDLRTPLTIIKGYAELIKDISGDDKEKRSAQLDIIIKETDRLTILVRDMLDLSRLEANPNLEKKEVSLSHIVADTFDAFTIHNEKDGYNITAEIDEDLVVFADRTRLQLATYNLISNAINYTGDDKKVAISLKRTADNRARFEVTDTGVGIPPDEVKQIWERYYRAREHRRSVAGNGLGLCIVKSILDLHNATFGVDSTVGEGSTFWYEIELLDKKEEEK